MTSEDIVQIGAEMTRLLEPVYEDLKSIKNTQNEHSNKIDALMVDVKQLQDEMGALRDDLGNKERRHLEEHNQIRKNVGMPLLNQAA